MNHDQARALVRDFPIGDPAKAFELGIRLLREDFAEILLPSAIAAARKFPDDPRMQQLVGLAARASGDSRLALGAFAAAARLAPHDPLIAHSHARAALEAGHSSVSLFDKAIQLAPNDASAILGRTAALTQEGQAGAAAEYMAGVLVDNPQWIDGHRSLARLAGQCGRDSLRSIEQALQRFPMHRPLHELRVYTLLEARNLSGAEAAIRSAAAQIGDEAWSQDIAAHVASESGDHLRAEGLFASVPPPPDINAVSFRARHMIRAGRIDDAAGLLEQWMPADHQNQLWPYISLVWRLTSDQRHAWLEGDKELVRTYDLSASVADWAALAEHLRSLHFASAAPLDQSVRGGTQTDGNLLLRDDELIRPLRQTILDTVRTHVAQFPPARNGHPTLITERKPQRVAGSWSVRLFGAGYHSDHVHSHGWISSALYIALPESVGRSASGKDTAGWLSLGECRELVPDLKPIELIEPAPGKLVLFPSTMWHGTRPFSSGERLTIAFDIARPKQSLPE
ncbi:putative 2OG-Fe(II) oxygenase [Allopontixanthobacter sediminis]|uniref:2OG-Fe(II) oxygenase n=1 Tax=Allopontixanthobacter sediminis TaxID=1689985 RepID=A0A845B4S1_9SPHN|nr:putative 2OG-Fe(II) oxygenase [Allopontixanthobacter sediminis]MXP45134.1 hypothetical protein [Allopontixanthobacter sediminis]